MNVRYSIQGLRNGEWTTLFTYAASREAQLRLRSLVKSNPACRYRLRWHGEGEPIVEQFSQPRTEY